MDHDKEQVFYMKWDPHYTEYQKGPADGTAERKAGVKRPG